jgi:HEAT repeat protein
MNLLAAALGLLGIQDESMETLVERFRSGDVEARSAAEERLLARWNAWKEADLEALDAAMADPDSEVAERARDVRSRIRLRRTLGEKVLQEVPGAEAAFARGSDRDKLAALGLARVQFDRGRLRAEDLKGMEEVAATARWEDARALTKFLTEGGRRVFEIPLDPRERVQLRARGVERLAAEGPKKAPEVAGFLRDEEPAVRGAALRSLDRMGARDQAPRVALLLRDVQAAIRWDAVEVLGAWGKKEYAPEFVPLLKDPSWTVRSKAAEALAGWGAKEFAREIAPLLKDPAAQTRAEAAAALGEFGAGEFAGDIAGLLDDGHPAPRRNAAFALGKLGAREHAGRIRPLLKDPDLWVRISAVQALGQLGRGEHLAALVPLLRDPDPELQAEAAWVLGRVASADVAGPVASLLDQRDAAVRHAALTALERLGARGHARSIAACLKDESPWVRARAAEALGRLGTSERAGEVAALLGKEEDRRARIWAALALGDLAAGAGDPALRADVRAKLAGVEEDPDRLVGLAASTALVRMGEKDKAGQSRLLRELTADSVASAYLAPRVLEALARVHEKDACDRLDRRIAPPGAVASWADVAEMLKGAGFRLEAAGAFPLGRLDPGVPLTLRGALEFLLGRYVPPEIVPDGDRLRLLPRASALGHWQKRLDSR